MLQFLGGPPQQEFTPLYANKVGMIGNPQEIRLLFYLGSMGSQDILQAEIILAPMMVKGILRYLPEKLAEWEKDNGPIYMPEDVELLESLFQVKLSDDDEEDEEEPGS